LARFVTNTNTNTNTNTTTQTNTSTNTNTTTNTVTSTYGADADGDGFLQVSEIPADGSGGSDFLPRDPFEAGSDPSSSPLFYSEVDIVDQVLTDLVLYDLEIIDLRLGGDSDQIVGDDALVVEIPIFNENYTDYEAADAFYNLDEGALNLSVDDNYVTDLGANITILEVLGDGYVNIQKDILLNIDQEFAQDLLYELEDLVIDDLVVEINQTYTADILKTETRTRLVGE
jgi:hypothetical protein